MLLNNTTHKTALHWDCDHRVSCSASVGDYFVPCNSLQAQQSTDFLVFVINSNMLKIFLKLLPDCLETFFGFVTHVKFAKSTNAAMIECEIGASFLFCNSNWEC